jgi:hypothetical protein
VPIAFPPPNRGPDYNWPENLATFAPRYDVTNLAIVGAEFDVRSLDPGFPIDFETSRAVNLRNLDFQYEEIGQAARVNPVPVPVVDQRFSVLQLANAQYAIIGVSRDSVGAALGTCIVNLFRTSDNGFVDTTTSDGSGNYRFQVGLQGPYYVVMYKAGVPDRAGTSLNTVTATVV